jgi:hypothetical protein
MANKKKFPQTKYYEFSAKPLLGTSEMTATICFAVLCFRMTRSVETVYA